MTDATMFGTLPDDTDPAGLWLALFSARPFGLAVIDRQLRYCLINPLLAEANGRSVDEHRAKPVREVLPDLAPMLEPLLRQVIDSGVALMDVEGCVPPPHTGEHAPREWIASYLPYRNRHDEIAWRHRHGARGVARAAGRTPVAKNRGALPAGGGISTGRADHDRPARCHCAGQPGG
ncbi:PAS domain-containing protein [Paludibacterium denitrificans]|uniref:PAS domain-containing protein n=1 Tax=Paludibacterium denitrificans TaxID=2675226 RepID=A0A844GCC0_9NEIS|nr:PAS domain-containing protein [Paludibacterium denitrificans]MTD32557.1 PAS domain-containing protein [Paludibacterium denitrificans]